MNFIVLNRKRNKFDMAQFSATQRAFMVKKYYETKSYDQVQLEFTERYPDRAAPADTCDV